MLSFKKHPGSLNKIKEYVFRYRQVEKNIRLRTSKLLEPFSLTRQQKQTLDFEISKIIGSRLQDYLDLLHADEVLILLHQEKFQSAMEGCLHIVHELVRKDCYIPGYDLEAFVKEPEEYTGEISKLMHGLLGSKHIHFIRGKLALEVPPREYIKTQKELLYLIDYWGKQWEKMENF